jgi:multidrug efflux pump
MNISRFFIDRPIFAGVLSSLILLAGLIALSQLPVSEYPEVIPPSVIVRAQYPGANPKVIADTVAAPLEEQINGVEGMLYMQSQASSDGNMALTITFRLGVDPDKAQNLVQNRVQQALPRLPPDVQLLGVATTKSSPTLTMVVHLISPDSRYDQTYLRNYALINIKERLERIPGIGEVQLHGSGDYAMRIWLNPNKLAERNLTAGDVVKAIRDQNIQVAAGLVGQSPMDGPVPLQLDINTQGRLQTEDDFRNIVLKANGNSVTYIKDVARVELGAAEFGSRALMNNRQAVAMWIFQLPGANSLDISNAVRAAMKDMSGDFPAGIEYSIIYDPTQFVKASIHAVIHTLLEAIALVVIVVIVFLQTWRASLIPLIAVPVSIIGTFSLLLLFGYTVNTLSLFGMVLAIGIVVDDAIVVVENVERNIQSGLPAREATHQAMSEVSGPIIAIALTLVAVFVPLAFMSGLIGQFYKQFAITIAISTVISAFNSLTLSPALAAILLKGHDDKKDKLTILMDRLFGRFFAWFNRVFHKGSESYGHGIHRVIDHKGRMVVVYLVLLAGAVFMAQIVPSGFIPLQDKQYLICVAQLPNGASLDRTEAVSRQMADIALKQPGALGAVQFPGMSINGFNNSSSAAIVFVTLQDFDKRTDASMSADSIAAALNAKFAQQIKEGYTAVFPPPPILGLGSLGGFKFQIEDRQAKGYTALNDVAQAFIKKASQTPELGPTFSSYQINVPQLQVDVDRVKAQQLGLSLPDIFNTMQVYLGSQYVNDFNRFGRVFQVRVQADAPFRSHPEDIGLLKTRNAAGEMIPLSSLVRISQTYGPETVVRYNGYTAADISGGPAPGYSEGQAQAAVEKIAASTLPHGFKLEWTDLAFQQIIAGNASIIVFPVSILLVFLTLAALYESFTLPLAVILIVPMSLLCALAGVWLTRGDNNIFTQVGLMILVGLASKNAILIVEFARELEIQGRSIVEAAIEASRLRLRPILMTSAAFIMGVIPLALSTGAGAETRRAMGIAVFFGMLGVTLFGLLLTPVFYVLLRQLAGSKQMLDKHGHNPRVLGIEEAGL